MKVLVTAGNTQTPIDRVRCITNVFSGQTGAQIAARAHARGHAVVLLTSHPEIVKALPVKTPAVAPPSQICAYRTFDELEALMADALSTGCFDAVIHAAAVSDYHVTGVFGLAAETRFDSELQTWNAGAAQPRMVEATAGKVKSHHAELWMRLQPAPKLVDRIRTAWRFRGTLVKFKLEVGTSDAELLDVAERSRRQSDADMMVANTLEGMPDWAYLGVRGGAYKRVSRGELPDSVIDAICKCQP